MMPEKFDSDDLFGIEFTRSHSHSLFLFYGFSLLLFLSSLLFLSGCTLALSDSSVFPLCSLSTPPLSPFCSFNIPINLSIWKVLRSYMANSSASCKRQQSSLRMPWYVAAIAESDLHGGLRQAIRLAPRVFVQCALHSASYTLSWRTPMYSYVHHIAIYGAGFLRISSSAWNLARCIFPIRQRSKKFREKFSSRRISRLFKINLFSEHVETYV